MREKISNFCHVPVESVLAVHDCTSVYHVPLLLLSQGLLNVLKKRLQLTPVITHAAESLLFKWKQLAERQEKLSQVLKIALVGKYTSLHDSYISVVKSLEHAGLRCNSKVQVYWIEAESLEPAVKLSSPELYAESWAKIKEARGVLVPGGFGERGTEGKILAINYARVHDIPFLGICLGFQMAVVEFSRNVLGLLNANSAEFLNPESKAERVVISMPEISQTQMGGTMRLGSRVTIFTPDSDKAVARRLYSKSEIHERHRHRYEVSPSHAASLEKAGLKFIGKDPKGERMGVLELTGHKFFVACQFHPEFMTRPLRPVPLFLGFIAASAGVLDSLLNVCVANIGRASANQPV